MGSGPSVTSCQRSILRNPHPWAMILARALIRMQVGALLAQFLHQGMEWQERESAYRRVLLLGVGVTIPVDTRRMYRRSFFCSVLL
jgi:hypothetical protein